MKAVLFDAVGSIRFGEVPPPVAAAGEAVVSLRAAALNHRDLWIFRGQYAGLKFPLVPGSDGAGVVSSVGEGVDPGWIGREVLLNPSLDWGAESSAQGPGFNILGLPRDGTWAESVAVPAAQLADKPSHLTWVEAAALPLAGLTAHRALSGRARAQAGERVLVTGIGGGVAVFSLQFAVAKSARVWVTSGSDAKIAQAVRLGAQGGFRYDRPGWVAEAKEASGGGFDVIVDGAGGEGFDALLDAALPGARIVSYGGTRGPVPQLLLRKLFWKQLSLLGSTMGGPADWKAMLQLVTARRMRPLLSSVRPLARAAEALEEMEAGSQMGKLVLAVGR